MTGTGTSRRARGRAVLVALACTVAVVGLDAGPALGATSRTGADHGHREHDAHRADGHDRFDSWPVYGHDLANTRLNPLEHRIDRSSVGRLTTSWSKDGLVGVTGTPTVSGGVAYFGDWTGTVWAVRARTGATIWTTKIGGIIVGAPAIRDDAVYASSGGTLFRLDRRTGAVQWKVVVNDHPLAQINASPVVVGNLVIQGVASAEVTIPKSQYTFRGSIGAYDTATGRQVWRLFTTPNDATSGAGIGIWSTPAIDVARGVLYVGSGNNYSPPTGPLADSLLAIDYRTGRIVWSRQFTNPDVFSAGHPGGKDADVGASPNLWVSHGRALVGAGDKTGVFHALDRDTGKVVWETRLTPGGMFGGEIGSAALVDGRLVLTSNVGDAPSETVNVFALDPSTGAILWERTLAGHSYAPVGAVHGVGFVGTDTGLMAALDTRTGATLWQFQAPARTGCGPSIVRGRVLWGYGFTLFAGPGPGGVISFTLPGRR